MIRFEHLADDLIAVMRAAGYVVDETLERQVRERAVKPVIFSITSPTGSTTTTHRGSSCAGATP